MIEAGIDDDNFSPIAILIDEFGKWDVQTVALVLGTERTRNELIPFLTDIVHDENDELLLALAEQLGTFVPLVGGPEFAYCLLLPLETLATAADTVVRNKAVDSLRNVAASLSPQDLEEYFVPLIRRLSNGESITSKTSACGLFSCCYACLSSSLKTELRRLLRQLLINDKSKVSLAAALQLLELATVMDFEDIKSHVLPLLHVVVPMKEYDVQWALQVIELGMNVWKGILDMDQAALSAQDRSQLAKHQSLLCEALNKVLSKIKPYNTQDIAQYKNIAANIMPVLMVMFQRAQDENNPADLCNQYKKFMKHALLTVVILINSIGPAFSEYMKQFLPVLLACLQNSAQPKICSSAVHLLDHIAWKLGPQLVPHLEDVFPILFAIIGNQTTDRSLLPQIISVITNFTLYFRHSIVKYHGQVIKTLIKACKTAVELNDPDMINYLNLLIQRCVEAFDGLIIFVLTKENIKNHHVQSIIDFLGYIAYLPVKSEELIEESCRLVEDIAIVFDMDSARFLYTQFIKRLLKQGRESDDPSTKRYAARATNEVNRLRNSWIKKRKNVIVEEEGEVEDE